MFEGLRLDAADAGKGGGRTDRHIALRLGLFD